MTGRCGRAGSRCPSFGMGLLGYSGCPSSGCRCACAILRSGQWPTTDPCRLPVTPCSGGGLLRISGLRDGACHLLADDCQAAGRLVAGTVPCCYAPSPTVPIARALDGTETLAISDLE